MAFTMNIYYTGTNVNQEELKTILGDGNITMTLKSKE